jgi:hypothetical protein
MLKLSQHDPPAAASTATPKNSLGAVPAPPGGGRKSRPILTGPEAHSTSYTVGTGRFTCGKRAGANAGKDASSM